MAHLDRMRAMTHEYQMTPGMNRLVRARYAPYSG